MPEQARVTAIEALEAFRTRLVVYLDKAGRVLDEISDDVTRTRLWLETDRRLFWEKELRRRQRQLEQKQGELLSARLSELQAANPLLRAQVQEARRAVQEAQAKIALVKQWSRQYDNRVAPAAKEADKLREVLSHEMRKAVAWLDQATKTLDAYAGTRTASEASARIPPAAAEPSGAVAAPQPGEPKP